MRGQNHEERVYFCEKEGVLSVKSPSSFHTASDKKLGYPGLPCRLFFAAMEKNGHGESCEGYEARHTQ